MLDLLEIFAAVEEMLFSWRFFICGVLWLDAFAADCWLVPDRRDSRPSTSLVETWLRAGPWADFTLAITPSSGIVCAGAGELRRVSSPRDRSVFGK
jgi:hypothetical protein